MTSRLRDVLAITAGLYFVALGLLFLVDTTGLRSLGTWGLIQGAIGLALIALGALVIFAAVQVRRVSRRLGRTLGHVRVAREWHVDDAVIRTVLGDITLDLREADVPPGETELTLLCWIGTVHVRVPREIGLDVEAHVIAGSVNALGLREEGLFRDVRARSDGYEQNARRLRLQVSTLLGEITVASG